MKQENWPHYVGRVALGLSRRAIAEAAGVNVSAVSRWMTGVSLPSAEAAVTLARGLGQPPIEALMAAGIVRPDEVDGAFEVMQVREWTDAELLAELAVRLAQRPVPTEVDDITHRMARTDESFKDGEDGQRLG
jgi:transcriptional regulator with XRE-family HTH domain